MVCSKCHVNCDDTCPICGSRKKLRIPGDNDPVLLITVTGRQTICFEPVLEESGIPYSRRSSVGGWLSVGMGMPGETVRYYVPYGAYEKAREAVEQVFIEDDSIMRALHEFDT